MSEWNVITVIVTLAGFIIAVVTPLVKLNNTITRINTTVEELEKDLETLTKTSSHEQTTMIESEKEQNRQIAELQIRLAIMERSSR